jgi:hypothetical protein
MSTPMCVYNYAQLRTLPLPPGSPQHCDYIFVSGFPDPAKSGLQGFFEWRPNSPVDDDSGTVIRPNTIPVNSKGRWHRVHDGPVSVRWFGATGDGDTNPNADDTEAIHLAVSAAALAGGGIVFFPAGTYVINGAKNTDGKTGKTYGIALKSNVTFSGAGWTSILRLKDNSTANQNDPQMFYAGPSGALSNLVFQNLAFDGNAQHNQLGAAHGTGGGAVGDNRNCCAIFIGGMNNGDGVSLTGLTIQNCYFSNFPGANVVLVHDRKSDPASTFSSDVLISGNTFYDNRKADGNRDHSTVNVFADNTRVIGNRFALPANATDLQKQLMAACELHGSASCFNHNTLSYYGLSVIFSENLHHDCLSQEAVGNVMCNIGYRGFDINVSGFFKRVIAINIVGNAVHFGTVEAVINQTLVQYSIPIPFPKWGIAFYVGTPAVLDSLNVTGNTFDGDASNQVGHVAGVAGLWGGGGYWGVEHLNVSGNTFRRLTYGVWQDSRILTVAKHSTIVGNRFEDLGDPTKEPDPNNPISPPAGSARAVYMTSNGGPNGVMSVSASGNSFVNEWNDPTYHYAFFFQDTVFCPSIGENWYYQIKKANLAFDSPSSAMVVALPALSSRAVVSAAYGPSVIIDPGLSGRFMLVASNTNAFTINSPSISGTKATFTDGTEIEIVILNASGGPLGNVTWGAAYRTSWSNAIGKPSDGFNVTLRFRYERSSATWLEVGRGSESVPN